MTATLEGVGIARWRFATFALFLVNGLVLGTWASRIPAVADDLGLGLAQMGVLITAIPVGALVGLLLSSHVLERLGGRRTALLAQSTMAVALSLFGVTATVTGNVALGAGALVVYGFGIATTNIVINLEAATSDRASGRTLMPVFHASWSVGAFIGAGLGALASSVHLPIGVHFPLATGFALIVSVLVARYLPRLQRDSGEHSRAGFTQRMRVWVEPRTLLIGVVVLAASFNEGTANSWLALSMVTGRDWTPGAAATTITVFTAAMLVGRLGGGALVDRFGRVAALRTAFSLAGAGVLVVVFVDSPVASFAGVALWGLGASLGYPLGMSAAADDPHNAAARVAAVATVSTISGLVGPSVIGLLGELVGLPQGFIAVALLLIVGLVVSSAARPPRAVV